MAALACLLTAALVGAAGWCLRPVSKPPRPLGLEEASPAVPTDLGTLATQGGAGTPGAQVTPLPVAADDTTTAWATSLGDVGDASLMGTPHGPIVVAPEEYRSSADGQELPEVATIYALDADTGELRWQRSIQPAALTFTWGSTTSIRAVTSPDGEYLALALQPQGLQPPVQTVVVLSSGTGEVVRSVETRENLLGLALTDDALVVQTSSTHHPEGGSVSLYPLASPKDAASAWPSTGWLVGATSQGVIQSATRQWEPCTAAFSGDECFLSIVTISDPVTGQVQQTFDRVTLILPSGVIERLADDQMVPPPNDPAWITARRELVNLDTGATTDITGYRVSRAVAPTGNIWLLSPLATAPDPDTPVSDLLPPAWTGPDGTVSTDPVETIEFDHERQEDTTALTRTTMTMSAEG